MKAADGHLPDQAEHADGHEALNVVMSHVDPEHGPRAFLPPDLGKCVEEPHKPHKGAHPEDVQHAARGVYVVNHKPHHHVPAHGAQALP